jgi:tRNA (mo5U34)-methyltransferase
MDLDARVRTLRWYHTLELPGGIVTAGRYDLRPALARLPLPASLAGKRCLDVGTHDGFWAFEMERRGAGEVVAIDLDDPAQLDWAAPVPPLGPDLQEEYAAHRAAFEVAHEALGSAVRRVDLSVYELTPDAVGEFDFATIGTLLLHLRDPVGALVSIARVLRGELLCNDAIAPLLSLVLPRRPAALLSQLPGQPFWWLPNAAALRSYLLMAGYDVLASGRPYLVRNGAGFRAEPLRLLGVREARLLRQLLLRRGMPHAWALGRPGAAR